MKEKKQKTFKKQLKVSAVALENLLALPEALRRRGAEEGNCGCGRLSSQADLHLALCRTISKQFCKVFPRASDLRLPLKQKVGFVKEDSSSVVLTQQALSSSLGYQNGCIQALQEGGGPGKPLGCF